MSEFGLKIDYKGVGKSKAIQISDILDVHEDNLTEHFAEQASIFGYFSVQLAEAERILGKIKVEAEQEYAKADAYYRDQYKELDEKYTEAVIRGHVILDDDYNKVLDRQRSAKHNVDVIKAVVNALKMRADMLISMGAHLRQEYGMTGMTIREQSMEKEMEKVKEAIKRKREE